MLVLLIRSSSGVWMTTTDSSRQSSGTLADSQPVGVYSNFVFNRTVCLFELCVYLNCVLTRCTPSPTWLPQGHLLLRNPLSSSVRPDDNP